MVCDEDRIVYLVAFYSKSNRLSLSLFTVNMIAIVTDPTPTTFYKPPDTVQMRVLYQQHFRTSHRKNHVLGIAPDRERVLFIGTHLSNLYIAVDTPAEAAWLCA